ncbi:MAG: hypothetical protein WCE58_04490 [Gallionella sp.]
MLEAITQIKLAMLAKAHPETKSNNRIALLAYERGILALQAEQ